MHYGTVTKAVIHLAIEREKLAMLERLLIKMKAAELSELRRVQTQLSVYGDRRSSMDDEPAAIAARIDLLADLLRQVEPDSDAP